VALVCRSVSRWRGDLLPLLLELTHHFHSQFAGCGMPGKLIGGREEETFQRLRSRSKIADQRRVARGIKKIARTHELSRLQIACDIEHGLAFAHRERLLEHLSVRDLPENIAAGHGMIKEIFACLERALRMPPRVNLK